jgi:hypothetical protein
MLHVLPLPDRLCVRQNIHFSCLLLLEELPVSQTGAATQRAKTG